MAKLLFLLSFLLLVHFSTSTPHHHHHHHHHNHHQQLKSLHFSLFQHETINKTGFIVLPGVAGNAGITQTTTPFGTLYVFNDPMTTTPKVNSRVAGICEGTSITTSMDGLRSLSLAKITLKYKGYEGSISILGGVHNTNPSAVPVSGGTGDFMFAQGYVRSSPVDLKGSTVTYKVEFHLYWPPYATELSM